MKIMHRIPTTRSNLNLVQSSILFKKKYNYQIQTTSMQLVHSLYLSLSFQYLFYLSIHIRNYRLAAS